MSDTYSAHYNAHRDLVRTRDALNARNLEITELIAEVARWKRLEQYSVDQRVILERALREIADNTQATSGSWLSVLLDIRVMALRALGEHP